MTIKALPKAAVRAIGSAQTLTDPTSLVKELIDNAIDARASSVFVDISSNSLDVIQVRDNGHGIAPNDRPLLARRYCTSKIKDEKDLATIGGSFLGFRGEALSSAAEMSGTITITTRIEGEDSATTMKIGLDGEIISQERASHPVGTTVRVTDFLSRQPVRKQVALKGAVKTLAKIKHVLQTYAFARLTTRLSLRVLKAKNDRDNWTYAPKAGATVEDTALKVVGKPCASQCALVEYESEGFQIHAYVPRVDAHVPKIAGASSFVSIDGRPMSCSRGVSKQIVKIFKTSLRTSNPEVEGMKDPFIYMNISCPEGSYDPNVEPAKDDVFFEDTNTVLAVVRDLFDSVYPVVEVSQPQVPVPSCMQQFEGSGRVDQTSAADIDELLDDLPPRQTGPYKTNMYDMDEEDVQILADVAGDSTEQAADEGDEADTESDVQVSSSNPWIVAKMTGRTGKTNLGHQTQVQLITPAREAETTMPTSSSPIRDAHMPYMQQGHPALVTPRESSPVVHHVEPSVGSSNNTFFYPPSSQNHDPASEDQHERPRFSILEISPSRLPGQRSESSVARDAVQQGMSLDQIPNATQRKRGASKTSRQQFVNSPFKPPVAPERDSWFETPEEQRYTRKTRSQRQFQQGIVPVGEPGPSSQQPRLLSPPPNNRDIRSFVSARSRLPKTSSNAAVPNSAGPYSTPEISMNDENHVPTPPRPSRSRPGFVLASEINVVDDDNLPEQDDMTAYEPPKRRRKTGERTLVEVSGNAQNIDDINGGDVSHEPHHHLQWHPSGRRTSDNTDQDNSGGHTHGVGGVNDSTRLHRIKSSMVPLERVPRDKRIQTVISALSVTQEQIASNLEIIIGDAEADAALLIPWNQPAIINRGVNSALELVGQQQQRQQSTEIEHWAVKLDEVLRTRGLRALSPTGRSVVEHTDDFKRLLANALASVC